MAFKIADFKKTTRKAEAGRRIYPYQIRDDRYTAALGYAIAYYERMVGRRRAEFEADTLLEFFGDPRLARGLVACLGRTYTWREPNFTDALGEEAARTLRGAGLTTPASLRARLYGLANGRYGGVILPHERAEAIAYLCEAITARASEQNAPTTTPLLRPDQFEQGLTLDAEDQHVLVKQSSTPDPREVVARYNYHSIETALCHTETLRLELRGPIWNILRSAHTLARRYRLRYTLDGAPNSLFDEHLTLTLYGARDALGSWLRTGRRLVRAFLRLLAAHPDSLAGGEAVVRVGGQAAQLKLDQQVLAVLGAAAREAPATSEPWEEDVADLFQRGWRRAQARKQTAGWRLRRDPEPLVGADALVVPDFVLQRGNERVLVCLSHGRAAATALLRDVTRLGGLPVVVVAPAHAAPERSTGTAYLLAYESQPDEVVPALLGLLERAYPRSQRTVRLTPWQQLELLVAETGFVGEERAAALLGCRREEVATIVQRWGGATLHALPGLGVCTPEAVGSLREAIDQRRPTRRRDDAA